MYAWIPCTSNLMAEWLGRASQEHENYCHDLEVMDLNPGQVELRVCSTSIECVLDPDIYF